MEILSHSSIDWGYEMDGMCVMYIIIILSIMRPGSY